MLRLSGGQVETLFDLGLPIEVAELPADLAGLDRLLSGTALLGPIVEAWDPLAAGRGRPTIPNGALRAPHVGQAALGVGL